MKTYLDAVMKIFSGVKNMLAYAKRNMLSILHRIIFLCVIALYVRVAIVFRDTLFNEKGATLAEAVERYGILLTCFLYSMAIAAYMNVPVSLFNMIGLFMYNPFETIKKARAVNSLMESPFVCFRVVTRGLFPKLVCDITEKNLETCRKVGLQNFKFEIVTDRELNIQTSNYVREVVVPSSYRTPNNTLYKARALHYCLSPNINILSPDDWIVHLDEETLLTEDVLHGILNFVATPNANIGQGVITYGGCGIENWLTTLLDGVRVCIDYGLFRFAMQFLHRPIFGFKGSFIVVKHSIEEKIGFDFGPKESIAEDLRFALTAWNTGYKFDFVHGVMKEKSTFSMTDFVKQRKRWFIGHFHVIWGNSLPLYCKMAVLPMNILNILLWTNVVNTILSFICPVPILKWQMTMYALLTYNILFMLAFGNFMSLCYRRYSVVQRLLIGFVSQCLVPVLGVVEAYTALKAFAQRNQISFEIVQKEVSTAAVSNVKETGTVV